MSGPGGAGSVVVLTRAFLRRDRWMIPIWSVVGALLYWSQAVSIEGLYASQADFEQAAAAMGDNAGFIAMAGPPRALDTVGGQVAWQSTAIGAVLAGLMSMFIVVRHTRAEEDAGREELLRSHPLPRHAPLVATMVVALAANLLFGGLVAISLATYPLAFADSVALGVGVALCGLLFAGVALLAAQLAASPRAAYGLVGAVIGAAYALRAVGDVTQSWVVWLSPIGWYQAMHAFSGLHWWPAALLAVGALATGAAGVRLAAGRDLDAALLASSTGPAQAGPRLGSATGLVWRLQRGSVIGWSAGLAFTGVAYGAIGDSVEDLLGDSEAARQLLATGPDPVAGFYATSGLMLALIASGFAISSALRMRGEESAGKAEILMATALTRRRWLLAHALVTTVGTLLVMLAGAASLGLGYALTTGDATTAVEYSLPALQWTAPMLVLAALGGLAHALHPRLGPAGWAPLGFAVAVLFFGETWRMPRWLRDLSPFEHLPFAPAEEFSPVAALVMIVVAAGVLAVADVALRRRDLA